MTLFVYVIRRRGGIGRRVGLKIPWWQHRTGSTPVAGTQTSYYYVRVAQSG